MINFLGVSCEIALMWIPQDFTDDWSILVQVMVGAARQQAITWANIDPDFCCHMVSLGHNELTHLSLGQGVGHAIRDKSMNIFNWDQAALRSLISVCPSICLSVCRSVCLSVRLSVCPSLKAACQFAADDILLYKICYNIQWIYFTIWEKGKEELSPLQYHFKSLHIISRHYKKSLLRSQIYHGYEELSTDTNYPIWRRQKLPYMKKTRKKKQVCGAACFMAAEIKFSEDVRLSVRPSHLFDNVPVITIDRHDVHAEGGGQRSRSQR